MTRLPPSRRQLLARCGGGFGSLALADLLPGGRRGPRRSTPSPRSRPHFPAKAKAVIWVFVNGGHSQVDTWDYKPELAKRDGKPLPNFDKTYRVLRQRRRPADEVAVRVEAARPVRQVGVVASSRTCRSTSTGWRSSIRSGRESNNHSPALFMMNTGLPRMGNPSRRVVGDLRPRQREREPARVRGHVRPEGPGPAEGAHAELDAAASCPGRSRAPGSSRPATPIDNLKPAAAPRRPAGAGST